MNKAVFRRIAGVLAFFAVFMADFLCGGEPPGALGVRNRRVLSVFSLNASNEARQRIGEGMMPQLRRLKEPYSITEVELEAGSEKGAAEGRKRLEAALRHSGDPDFDLILLYGDEAGAAIAPFLRGLPEGTAVVYIGASSLPELWRTNHPNSTAILRPCDPESNIAFGRRLMPDTDEIVLLASPRLWSFEKSAELQRRIGKSVVVKTLFLDPADADLFPRLLVELKHLSPRAFLVSLDWDVYFENQRRREDVAAWLKTHSRRPILSRRLAMAEHGFGGVLSRFLRLGQIGGETVRKIFQGVPARDIPVTACPEEAVVNHHAMRSFGLKVSALPADCRIVNAPPGLFREADAGLLTVVFVLCGICLMLCIPLCALLVRRKKWVVKESVLNRLPVRIVVFDLDGKVLFYHREAGVASKLGEDGYCSISDFPWLTEENFFDRMRHVCESGVSESWDYDFYGEKRSAVLMRLPDGLFHRPAVLTVSSDSARLQEARAEADVAAARFALTLKAIADGVVVTDENGIVKLINNAACEMFEVRAGEVVGKAFSDRFIPVALATGKSLAPLIAQALATGEKAIDRSARMFRTGSGTRLFLVGSASPLLSAQGKLHGAIGVFHNAGPELAEQNIVRERQSLLQQVCARVKMTFFRYDFRNDRSTPFLSHVFFRPLVAEKSQLSLEKWFTPASYALLKEQIAAFRSGASREINCRVDSDFDGTHRIYSICGVESTPGNRNECLGLIQDITGEERRNAEFHDTLLMLNSVLDNLPFPVFTKDPDKRFVYRMANRAFLNLLSLPEKEIAEHTDYEIMGDPAEASLLREHDEVVASTPGGMRTFEETYTLSDGRKHKFSSVKQLIRLSNGRRLLLGIATDITEEQVAKEKAEGTMKLLLNILNRIPGCIYIKDHTDADRYTYWNDAAEQMFGSRARIGSNNAELRMPERLRLLVAEHDAEVLKTGKSVHRRMSMMLGEGTKEIPYDIYKAAVKSTDGHDLIVAMAIDISQRMAEEEEKEKLLSELRNHALNADMLNRTLACAAGENDFNASVNAMLRIIGEGIGADRCYIYRVAERVFRQGFEWTSGVPHSLMEYSFEQLSGWYDELDNDRPVVICDAEVRPEHFTDSRIDNDVNALLSVPILENGGLTGFLGADFVHRKYTPSASDIQTLRDAVHIYMVLRERENRRERSADEQRLHFQVFENAALPMFLLDREARIVAANRSACDALGVRRGDVLQKKCTGSVCPVARKENVCTVDCPFRKALTEKTSAVLDFSRDTRFFRGVANPISGADGIVRFVLLTLFDTTCDHAKWTGLSRQDAELAAANQKLAEELEHDRMMKDCLELVVLNDDNDAALKRILSAVCTTLKFGGVADFAYVSDGERSCLRRQGYEMPPGYQRKQHDINVVYEDIYPHLCEVLKGGRTVRFAKNAQPGAGEELWRIELRQYLNWAQQKEIILAPVFTGGEFRGVLAVEHVEPERCFGAAAERIIRDAAHVIGLLYEREANHGRLKLDAQERALLCDLSGFPILELSPEGTIVSASDAACRVMQSSDAELRGRPGRIFYSYGGIEDSTLPDPVAETLKTGESQQCERHWRGGLFSVRTRPLSENGKISKILLCIVPMRSEQRGSMSEELPFEENAVLVVDDVPMNLKVIEAMLRRLGLTAYCASSGAAALELLAKHNVRCMLTDIWMPGMNGVALTRHVRADARYKNMHVFAVTADVESGKNFDTGCFDDIMLKPLTVMKLRKALTDAGYLLADA